MTGLLLIVASCEEDSKKAMKTNPISFNKEGELFIYQAETDAVLAYIDIEIADSDYETQTGLMYRENMESSQGMLFIFPDISLHSFYMKNTMFALDLIFIDENLRIVSFKENAQPLDESGLSSEVPVQYVLEINAGLRQQWTLAIGDRIEFKKL